jgi:hypothetical protein
LMKDFEQHHVLAEMLQVRCCEYIQLMSLTVLL